MAKPLKNGSGATDLPSALREACDIADVAITVAQNTLRDGMAINDSSVAAVGNYRPRVGELRTLAAGTPIEKVGEKGSYPRYLGTRSAGDKVVGFRFAVKHGGGHRHETLDVPLETILRIADAYRGCGGYGDGGPTAGHAQWHADNPDMPVPCSSAEQPPGATVPITQLVRNYLALKDRFDALTVGEKTPDRRHDFEVFGRLLNEAHDALRRATELVR